MARGLARRAVCRRAGFLRHPRRAGRALHDGHARGDRCGARRGPAAALAPLARAAARGRRRRRRGARRARHPPPHRDRHPHHPERPDIPTPVEWALSPTDERWKVPTRPGEDDDGRTAPTDERWKVPTRPGEDDDGRTAPTDERWKVPTRLGGEDVEWAVSRLESWGWTSWSVRRGSTSASTGCAPPAAPALPSRAHRPARRARHRARVARRRAVHRRRGRRRPGSPAWSLVDPTTRRGVPRATSSPTPTAAGPRPTGPRTTPGDRIEVGPRPRRGLGRPRVARRLGHRSSPWTTATRGRSGRAEGRSRHTAAGCSATPVPDGTMDLTAHVAMDTPRRRRGASGSATCCASSGCEARPRRTRSRRATRSATCARSSGPAPRPSSSGPGGSATSGGR